MRVRLFNFYKKNIKKNNPELLQNTQNPAGQTKRNITNQYNKNNSFLNGIKMFFGFKTGLNPTSFSTNNRTFRGPYLASKKSVEQSNNYLQNNYVSSREKIVDGFRDGGHNTKYDKWGQAISSNREIITIDKQYDYYLQNAITYVKQNTKKMSDTQKMKYIYKVVHDISGDFVEGQKRATKLGKKMQGNEVLLGEIFEKGCTSCRHKALMFKILADEIGLKTRLLRGIAFDLEGFGGHAWNEVLLPSGKRILVDVQNSRIIDIKNPGYFKKADLAGYFTVNNTPLYT